MIGTEMFYIENVFMIIVASATNKKIIQKKYKIKITMHL